MEKRDQWDEFVRMKLENLEVEPKPEDWDAIAKRLSNNNKNLFSKWRRYIAAATVLLAILAGGYYLLSHPDTTTSTTAETPAKNKPEIANNNIVSQPITQIESTSQQRRAKKTVKHLSATGAESPVIDETTVNQTEKNQITSIEQHQMHIDNAREKKDYRKRDNANQATQTTTTDTDISLKNKSLLTDVMPKKQKHIRQWHFGIGGGGGSNSAGNTSANDFVYSDFGMVSKFGMNTYNNIKQNVTHQPPLSFGINAGYRLTKRWTLQSGITYSMLASKWNIMAFNSGEAKQQLHFIGIPLSLNYTIAEWNRLRFYTSAGGAVDWNISGHIKTKYYDASGIFVNTQTESIRMTEPLFYVSGRAGVSYPLLHYLSAYLESGANYYFKNESSIETIRSNKPFQLSLQAGIQFGF